MYRPFVFLFILILVQAKAVSQTPRPIIKNGGHRVMKAATKPVFNLQESVARGQLVYVKECLSCHQADGGGVPHLNPPLDGSDVAGADKTKIIRIVLHGLTDRLPIDGEYYSNSMASHNNLTNTQIADVLTYVRQTFANKASAVLPEEVNAVRLGKK